MSTLNPDDLRFLEHAVSLARKNMQHSAGGPFGAVVVKDGKIVGEGWNQVTSSSDPTAHAEVQAIRNACRSLSSFQLDDCTLYSSCEPCPMCLGAIYWARPKRVVYAADRTQAAQAGFDDAFIYDEIPKAPSARKIPFEVAALESARELFAAWAKQPGRIEY